MPRDSKSPHQSLPLEVYEEIIGLVDVRPLRMSHDSFTSIRRKTLYACALVCRDWVPKSRIHLFRRVKLDHKHQADSFMATVTTTPQLGEYVQALEISLHDDSIYKVHRVLPSLLPCLTHLRYSSLPVLRPVFFVFPSHFPAVTSLIFENLGRQSFPEVVQILDRFPRLQKLELSDCVWPSPGSFHHSGQKRERYTLLSVSTFRSWTWPSGDCQHEDTIRWLIKNQPLNTLNEYRCNSKTAQPNNLHDLMNEHTSSLKRLELHVDLCTSEPEPEGRANDLEPLFCALESCRNLQDVGFKLGNPNSASFLQVMDSLLYSLPDTISRIEFMFLVPTEFNEIFFVDSDRVKWLEYWNTVDNVLASDRFPKLTYVELAVETSAFTYGFLESLVEMHTYRTLRRFLPKLYGRGILWCSDPYPDVAYPTIGDPSDWVPHARLFPQPQPQYHRVRKRRGAITSFPRSLREPIQDPRARRATIQ